VAQEVRGADWPVLVLTSQLARSAEHASTVQEICTYAHLTRAEVRCSLDRLIRSGLVAPVTVRPDGSRVKVYAATAAGVAMVEESCLCLHRRSSHGWHWLRTACRDCDCTSFNDGTWRDMLASPVRAMLTRTRRPEALHRSM
jgi:DNA-binding PadR family transcriptional regulator